MPVDASAAAVVSMTSSPVTDENGHSATFTIRLAHAPNAEVRLALASSLPSEGRLDTSLFVFTPRSWSTPKTVTVVGVDDALRDGSVAYQIDVAVTSDDSSFSSIALAPIALVNDDNDTPALVAVAGAAASGAREGDFDLETHERGGGARFALRLASAPSRAVVVAVRSSAPSEGVVDDATSNLVFTADDWNQPQPVYVSGVDDEVEDGDRRFEVVASVVKGASDQGYDGVSAARVHVTSVDDGAHGSTTLEGGPSPDGTDARSTRISFAVLTLGKIASSPK